MERVLADDFSGAAEVAGVGFRYGLKSAVQLDLRSASGSELTVLDLDSRSRSRSEAVRLVRSALDRGSYVFKKIDSILRGHVLAETQPFVELGQCRRALIVPFNPELGRTVRDGVYRVDGRPISETPFRDDPEYPALVSEIAVMLDPARASVRTCRPSDVPPETGIIVGEGETWEDLEVWARRVDERTLPVGGAPFFAAWLESRGRKAVRGRYDTAGGSVLVVSGTASRVVDWQSMRANGGCRVLPMPDAVFEEGAIEQLMDWADRVARALDETRLVVASIGPARLLAPSQSGRLVEHLAELAASVLVRRPVGQIWLEGGATASAVVRRMGWTLLEVVGELAPGVVQLHPARRGPLVVVKPGSYPWSFA